MSDEITNDAIAATDVTGGDVPEWVAKELSEARKEAAKYRTEKKQAVEDAKAAVSAEFTSKIEALEAQLAEKDGEISQSSLAMTKLKVALGVGISNDKVEDFAALLQGDTEEDFKSHAEKLKELFTADQPAQSKPIDKSQGAGGDDLPLNGDSLLSALRNTLKF